MLHLKIYQKQSNNNVSEILHLFSQSVPRTQLSQLPASVCLGIWVFVFYVMLVYVAFLFPLLSVCGKSLPTIVQTSDAPIEYHRIWVWVSSTSLDLSCSRLRVQCLAYYRPMQIFIELK